MKRNAEPNAIQLSFPFYNVAFFCMLKTRVYFNLSILYKTFLRLPCFKKLHFRIKIPVKT